jgi:hypothetical protein
LISTALAENHDSEGRMKLRRDILLAVTLAGAVATAAFGQVTAPSVGSAGGGTEIAASTPDFSGVWVHAGMGFGPQLSGPGPVRNKSRLPSGRSNFGLMVGDYTNPILKPAAAEVVKRFGEISLSGRVFPDPENQCLQNPVPYIFWNFSVRLLQLPGKVIIIYQHDHDFREIRLNQPHPATIVPSLHGDSVGHYDGETLVIDTIGVKLGPHRMIDRFGTPYTQALHVIERYRLLDYEATKEALERQEKEWPRIGAVIDPNYRGKSLQLEFTVEDEGVFTMPWSATITYRRGAEAWREVVCAENTLELALAGRGAAVPRADKPDF